MKRKFFILFVVFFVSFTVVLSVFSASRLFRVRGLFNPETTWTGGHPGIITYELGSANSGYTSLIDEA